MKFWKNKKKKVNPLTQQIKDKAEALASLNLCCVYFERNIQNSILFEPELETSEAINAILALKETLTSDDITDIVKRMKNIDNIEHYDGSGWFDYKLQLAYYLKLNGFEVELY